jgi:hypothetical protein
MALADHAASRRYYINFIFDLPAALDLELMQRALEVLVSSQDALRARFRGEQRLEQHIVADTTQRMAFAETLGCGWESTDMPEALRAAMHRLHDRLSVEAGPVLAVAEIADTAGVRKLLFAVSHLVADGFSMVLLLEDLIEHYAALRRGESPLPSTPPPIDQWAPRYHEWVNSPEYRAQLGYWESRPWSRALPLPRDFAAAEAGNVAGTARIHVTRLDAALTSAVHVEAPRRFGVTPRDFLVMAVARVLMRSSGGDAVALHLHDAGRKELGQALGFDFSRVVGAFSVRHCVFFERQESGDLRADLAAMQAQLDATPHGGAGLLPLRVLSDDETVAVRARRIPDAEVWFNYFGAVGETLSSRESADAEIPSRLSDVIRHVHAVAHDEHTPRGRVFSIQVRVSGGEMEIAFDYSTALHREDTVRDLARELRDELERMAR